MPLQTESSIDKFEVLIVDHSDDYVVYARDLSTEEDRFYIKHYPISTPFPIVLQGAKDLVHALRSRNW